ncbi:MAG: DNA-3-methyladenine glycosylase 2 family protein [Chloroflexota bacterium]|nr:DNA-3-methyladenine glycosylase 2 family protein [Chloroflexota bacterium]
MIYRRFRLRGPLDLARTLWPLRHGLGDRTIRLTRDEAWLAARTPAGPGTIRLRRMGDTVVAQAWGHGAAALLDAAPALIGEEDEPERLVAHHPIIRRLQRVHEGLRLPRSGRVFQALVPSVFEQKVTGTEAFRAYAALLRAHGEPAPGPAGLLVPPAPQTLAGLPYHAFHPIGIERRRAEVVRLAAACAGWLEAARDAGEASRRLTSLSGIGPWTAAEVVRSAFGDPDAVSVGDYHVPSMVAWALAGEPRADDARMLELLEPYRGQRGRVQRLLEAGRVTAPRYGPRMAPRRIVAL